MADHDYDRIQDVKRSAQRQLLAIPGVHAVGLGAKRVAGEAKPIPAIVVFVVRKKPATELEPHEIIPVEIEGVATDVIESDVPRLTADTNRYRPLLGGIEAGAGGVFGEGTLGCIARTIEEDPRIVGLTCWHVVSGSPAAISPTLTLTRRDSGVYEVGGTNRAGSLVALEMSVRRPGAADSEFDDFYVLYQTSQTDTLTTIAHGIKDEVNRLERGAIATAMGAVVTITAQAGFRALVQLALTYGPPARSADTTLRAVVSGDRLTIKGKPSNDEGIFTTIDMGSGQPTRGVFTRVAKARPHHVIAADIALAINKLNVRGLTASSAGGVVKVPGALYLTATVSTDVRVGQAAPSFCGTLCICCMSRIGFVADARYDIDTAIVQLDPGLEYKAEIEQLGPIRGTHTYQLSDVTRPGRHPKVFARGRTSGRVTRGEIIWIDVVGHIAGEDPLHEVQRWHYNAIMIAPIEPAIFSLQGDSGSAVINDDNKVVGILFAGDTSGGGYASPIAEIEAAFNIVVETADAPGIVKTVPPLPGHAFQAIEPEPVFVTRIRAAQDEIAATAAGREYISLVRRHAEETRRLVNANRRVGAVWQRNGGPQLVQAAFAMLASSDGRLPDTIDGRPLAECLRNIAAILTRFGSNMLRADLARYLSRVIDMSRLTYPQLLNALEATE